MIHARQGEVESGLDRSCAGADSIRDFGAEVVLETARMYLRKFGPGDALLLFELDSDAEVMRFITKGKATSLTEIEHEILPRILGYYRRSPPQGVWAAHLRSTGEFIGWFHLRADKIEPDEMELGYRLKRAVWGCGLATEGSRALVQKGVQDWGYSRICARAIVGNFASRRVMEKAGLQFEREFVYDSDMIPCWNGRSTRSG